MTRMQSDFEGMQAKQRKCWGQKEVETWSLIDVSTMCFLLSNIRPNYMGLQTPLQARVSNNPLKDSTTPEESLQRICAGYLACREDFLAKVPGDFAGEQLKEIEKTQL